MTSSPVAASSSSWMRLSPDLLWTDDGLRSAASSCHGGVRFFKGALPGRAAHGLVGGARKRMSSCREARSYFTVSNTSRGSARGGSRAAAREDSCPRAPNLGPNLAQLDGFFSRFHDVFGWVRPVGGMTAFPWLISGENSRAFCEEAARGGVLLAPWRRATALQCPCISV